MKESNKIVLVAFLYIMDALYYIFIPPQTRRACPVTYAERSEPKNTATLATSSGVPPRRNGICSAHFFFTSSDNTHVISVMINPGQIAFARTFLEPNSLAIDLAKPIIPALEAE